MSNRMMSWLSEKWQVGKKKQVEDITALLEGRIEWDMNDLLEEIRAGYAHYMALAGYPNAELYLKLTPQDCGVPHMELGDDRKMALVATDRGKETERKETYDIDMFLYWLFRDEAMSAGTSYAMEHREPDSDEDVRRVAFPKALEVIGKLSQDWRDRLYDEQQQILKVSPFFKIPQVAVVVSFLR